MMGKQNGILMRISERGEFDLTQLTNMQFVLHNFVHEIEHDNLVRVCSTLRSCRWEAHTGTTI